MSEVLSCILDLGARAEQAKKLCEQALRLLAPGGTAAEIAALPAELALLAAALRDRELSLTAKGQFAGVLHEVWQEGWRACAAAGQGPAEVIVLRPARNGTRALRAASGS